MVILDWISICSMREKENLPSGRNDKMKRRTIEHSKIDCNECEKITCPKVCFNAHAGSMIALGKLLRSIERESEIKIYVAGMIK